MSIKKRDEGEKNHSKQPHASVFHLWICFSLLRLYYVCTCICTYVVRYIAARSSLFLFSAFAIFFFPWSWAQTDRQTGKQRERESRTFAAWWIEEIRGFLRRIQILSSAQHSSSSSISHQLVTTSKTSNHQEYLSIYLVFGYSWFQINLTF